MPTTSFDQVENGTSALPSGSLGDRVKSIRLGQGLSLRALAMLSGLNVNTLSLIENDKTSPSVSTLQQLAGALKVPISMFFYNAPLQKRLVFTPATSRPQSVVGSASIFNLAQDIAGNAVQAMIVALQPGCSSGERLIVHTGHEFIFCVSGEVTFSVDNTQYAMHQGDSLLFEAHLPHSWQNTGVKPAELLLIIHPTEPREPVQERHFTEVNSFQKEFLMKIALITDDGKSISQHFGRAPFYLVVTIEDGKVTNREMRSKLGHNQFSDQPHGQEHHGQGHGFDPASHDRHFSMAQAISDCRELICGGMGMGAYQSMQQFNIKPIVTDIRDIDEAIQAYLDGKLTDHTELLH